MRKCVLASAVIMMISTSSWAQTEDNQGGGPEEPERAAQIAGHQNGEGVEVQAITEILQVTAFRRVGGMLHGGHAAEEVQSYGGGLKKFSVDTWSSQGWVRLSVGRPVQVSTAPLRPMIWIRLSTSTVSARLHRRLI